ncbi:MAG: BrxA/BrxB family bacilliredoxin [Phycisphaerales bacterium]|nr:BrxA/BrxB family bacilliredoxin [Phycisphaerales bacterium]
MYPIEIVKPMKEELSKQGFTELLSVESVDNAMKKTGTSLIVINSICGCAAGSCRPAAIDAVKKAKKKPNNLFTSFAGYDVDAVKKLREYFLPYPPSSPAIAIIKDGKVVSMTERHHIEGRPANVLANHLVAELEKHCL